MVKRQQFPVNWVFISRETNLQVNFYLLGLFTFLEAVAIGSVVTYFAVSFLKEIQIDFMIRLMSLFELPSSLYLYSACSPVSPFKAKRTTGKVASTSTFYRYLAHGELDFSLPYGSWFSLQYCRSFSQPKWWTLGFQSLVSFTPSFAK